jgi:hypothetical protein
VYENASRENPTKKELKKKIYIYIGTKKKLKPKNEKKKNTLMSINNLVLQTLTCTWQGGGGTKLTRESRATPT